MKIKVTFEKEFDSDGFYNFPYSKEELKKLTFEQFKKSIILKTINNIDTIITDFKFEEIKE